MRTLVFGLLLLALGSLVVQMVAAAPSDDEDAVIRERAITAAQKDVRAASENVDGKDFAQQCAKLAKDHQLYPVMYVFKPKTKGGIGLGGLLHMAEPKDRDSIELLLMRYHKNPPTKAEVVKYSAELQQIGRISLVIAEVTNATAPPKRVGGLSVKQWMLLTEEMRKSSAALIAAAKAQDEKAVGVALKKLNTTCVDCHPLIHDER